MLDFYMNVRCKVFKVCKVCEICKIAISVINVTTVTEVDYFSLFLFLSLCDKLQFELFVQLILRFFVRLSIMFNVK